MEDIDKHTNLENLKGIIRNIALRQSQELAKEANPALTNKRKFDISKVVEELAALPFLDGFDKEVIERAAKDLDASVTDIMDSGILVQDQGMSELVPAPYEVIRLIFISNNKMSRRYFFHDLMDYYYHELQKNAKEISTIRVPLKEEFDQQVKISLPIVKLELIRSNVLNGTIHADEMSSNVTNFFECPKLNQEDIFAIVNNRLSSDNYKLLSYKLIQLDQRNGYLGDYFTLKIRIEFENSEKILKLFAKFLTPKLEVLKEVIRSGPSMKEDFFYRTFLPLLEQNDLQSLMDFCPKCYFSKLNDVLVLDDMLSLGFTAFTPNIKLQLDGLMCGVKQIAKFHSCSMILEELLSQEEGNRVTLDEIYGDYLKDIVYNSQDESLKENFRTTLKLIHYVIEKFPLSNSKFTNEELTRKINGGWNMMSKQVTKSKKFKNTICHGDMYVGNMLFKFDKYEACTDTVLIDFQLLRYCPPVQDLLFFIYHTSLKEVRDKHLRQLLDGYYSELSRQLENFKLDIARIYPKEEFEESVIYMKSQALFQALCYSQLNALDPTLRTEILDNPKMQEKYMSGDRRALIDLGFEDDDYRKVVGGLVEDLVELCERGIL